MGDDLSKWLDALQADYPVLHQLIGDDYFTVMGCRYFQRHPAVEDATVHFGKHLSGFLKTEKPYANVPSLAELADFESAMRQAVSAVDVDIVTPEYWQSLSAENRNDQAFRLHQSLTILKLEWNAPQIWEALSSGKEVPEPEVKPGYWLVYKNGWRGATPLEVAALESVYHGLTYAELCEELCNLVDDVESVPVLTEEFLCSWIEQGFLLPAFLFAVKR